MKLRRCIPLLVIALGISLFTGCQSEPQPEKKEEIKPAKIQVDYLSEMDDIDSDDCTLLTNPRFKDSEYLEEIVIVSDQNIKNFKLMDVEMGTVTDEDTYFYENETIFKTKNLDKGEPLLIQTEFTEYTPNLVFAYKDTDGKEKMYSISMSGKDSSIVTAPALLEEGKKPEPEEVPAEEVQPQENNEELQYGEEVPIGPYGEEPDGPWGIIGPYEEIGDEPLGPWGIIGPYEEIGDEPLGPWGIVGPYEE